MAKKKTTTKKTETKKDAAAFVDFIHADKKMRATLKKGWDAVVAEGKRQGYKFSRQELNNHLKKKYRVKSLPGEDEPDTCICII